MADEERAMLASATVDDILELTVDGEVVILEASAVRTDGDAGLAWTAMADGPLVIVANKYRMMCAMLNDAVRNCAYAHAINNAVQAQLSRTGECLVLDM